VLDREVRTPTVSAPGRGRTYGLLLSQKITAATILLRAMPEPSTPKGRNLRKEAQALLEDAAV